MELSMNNKQLRKALKSFANGHKIGEVAQFIDIDERELLRKFKELAVADEYTALKALQVIDREEAQKPKNPDGGKWEIGGKVEPVITVVKNPEYVHKGEFDRNKIVVNSIDENIIPLAEQHRFKRELREDTWDSFAPKWMSFLNITEVSLKEQVKKLAPTKYKEIFAGEKE